MSKKLLIAVAMLMWGSTTALPALADEANIFGTLDTVAASDLDSARGMHTPEIEDLEGALQAVLDGNTSVDNGSVRTNTINASFVGATGIATVVQNAGNNVIIQTATMVTVNYN